MNTSEPTLELKPKTFGILSMIAGFFGLFAVAVGPSIRDTFIPPPPAERQISEAILSIKRYIGAKPKETKPTIEAPRQPFSARELPHTLSVVFSALAFIGGAVSFLLKEGYRYACIAGGLGIVTLFWHTVLFALAALILFFILFLLLRFFALLE
ncbi:MAG: hypothetical protein WCO60_09070 [Verrucomicrobiota bacterium]